MQIFTSFTPRNGDPFSPNTISGIFSRQGVYTNQKKMHHFPQKIETFKTPPSYWKTSIKLSIDTTIKFYFPKSTFMSIKVAQKTKHVMEIY